MISNNFIEFDRLANEASSACDSAIKFIKSISRQYPEDNHEPLSWENGERLIARYADSYCRFFAEVKEYTEGARKKFETSKRFSKYYYKKCKYLDRDIFHESYLIGSKEFSPFIVPIVNFISYYSREYEALAQKNWRGRLRAFFKY